MISKFFSTCFVLIAGFQFLFSGCNSTQKKESGEKPNILILIAEDISPELGCYGNEYATTPNIDKMAESGMVYDFALTTAPICAPSRSALASGLYATSLVTKHLRSEIPFPEKLKTLPELLRENGYFTSNRDKTDYNFDPEGMWEHWSSEYTPWRHRADGQPFYSFMNIGPSHEGSVNNLQNYKRFVEHLPAEMFHDPAKVPLPPYYPDSPKTRETWAHYYDMLTVLDQNVGMVLDSLAADGLMEETIVFFIADHGFGMPRYKRWLYKTGMHVPMVVHVPKKYEHLVPGFSKGGHNANMVSFIDLPATLLNLAGAEVPGYFEGKPIMGENAEPEREYAFGARDRADDMFEMSRSVTDGRYFYVRNYMPHLPYIQSGFIFSDEKETFRELRLLHNAGQTDAEQEKLWNRKPVEELYDWQSDPRELNNLANDPALEEIKNILKNELHNWMLETHDLGLLPEAEYMIRSEGSSPYEYARESGDYQVGKILEAAEMVGISGESELVEKLKDIDSGVRYWAVIGLMQLEQISQPAAKTLTGLLTDSSPSVQIAAAEALCYHSSSSGAVETLGLNVMDDRPWVALQAARSILLVGENARPLIPVIYKKLDTLYGGPDSPRKFKDFNYASFTGWALEWALQELGEDIQVN
ncbi:sulfatase-like hydrolase/transferase [Mariniphaga sp.]|uniref:sulfatase-like hydrolase/transferase n=1 Tax=Mariniphaga sp. TaxID=1954475 RepID=UPI003563E4BC